MTWMFWASIAGIAFPLVVMAVVQVRDYLTYRRTGIRTVRF